MKKLKRSLLLVPFLMLFAVVNSDAQIIVRTRPVVREVVVVRPARPSVHHVWVTDEYVPRGRRYVRRSGHWVVAPRPNAVWVSGHWDPRPHGYIWISGTWR